MEIVDTPRAEGRTIPVSLVVAYAIVWCSLEKGWMFLLVVVSVKACCSQDFLCNSEIKIEDGIGD